MVFFGGTGGSGATIAVLSDTPAGASPSFGGSAGDAVAAADAVAGPGAVPEAGAIAGASATPALASAVGATGAGAFAVVAVDETADMDAVVDVVVAGNAAFGDDAFAGAALAVGALVVGALAVGALAVGALAADVIAGAGAAVFTAAARGWLCDVAREDVRPGLFGLSFAAAAEPGEDSLADVTAGATGAAGATDAAGTTGAAGTIAGATAATDGTAAVRTLVTIARAAVGVLSGSPERSIRDSTTPAPAVAPIAVATRTTRAVRAKLGK